MNRFSAFSVSVVLLSFAAPLHADPAATSPNAGLTIAHDPIENVFLLSWWGIQDRFYFIEQSEDFVKWSFMPIFEVGSDDILSWALEPNARRLFFRVAHTADTDSGLMARDFDEDGLTTWQEYQLGSDPFNPDTSGDGIFDGIAFKLGLPLTPPPPPAPDPFDTAPPVIDLTSPASAVAVP